MIRMDTHELSALADAWQRAPTMVAEELEEVMYLSSGMLHREIVDTTPTGASGGSGAGLSGSITYQVASSAGEVTGIVGTANPYAVPVEMGTRPHFPPVSPIRDWVEAKLGISEDKSRGVAYLIARQISRTGTKGRHMFQNALDRLTPDIESAFRAAVSRVIARLEGAA